MKSSIWLALVIPAIGVGALVFGEAAYSPLKQRGFGESTGLNERVERARAEMKVRMEGAGPTEGEPKVQVLQTMHDFGVMMPDRIGATTFRVRNIGTGRLDLMGGFTTCKCVGYEVDDRQLEPGEEAQIKLEWKTAEPTELFTQRLSFKTNDKSLPELHFDVQGKVALTLAARPLAIGLGELPVDATLATGTVYLISEEWSEIQDLQVIAEDSRFAVSIEEVVDQSIAGPAARWVRCLKVTSPEGLSSGLIQTQLKVTGRGPGGESLQLEIPVEGKVAGRQMVVGPKLDASGSVEFGTLVPGQGASATLTLRISDREPPLSGATVSVQPEFLQVSVEPIKAEKGLHRITVTIPTDAPSGVWSGDQPGSMKVAFDHPRLEPLSLDVRFTVLSGAAR